MSLKKISVIKSDVIYMLKKYCEINEKNNCNINYIIYLPDKINDNVPLLYLHEIGERGNEIKNVEKYALPKHMNKFDIPYIVVAPQCSKNNF